MTQTSVSDQRLTLRFEGRLDTARCAELDFDVRAALAEADRPVVFDLADVTFISSSFLRLCLFALKRAGEDRFHVVHAAPTIKKVFKIAGLDCMIGSDGRPSAQGVP
jgi:anti-anti-sigma factor